MEIQSDSVPSSRVDSAALTTDADYLVERTEVLHRNGARHLPLEQNAFASLRTEAT